MAIAPENLPETEMEAEGGVEMVEIKIPKEVLATVTENLAQLSDILKAANEKASVDIESQKQEEEGAGVPPPIGGNGLEGMGAELDLMRRSRGA